MLICHFACHPVRYTIHQREDIGHFQRTAAAENLSFSEIQFVPQELFHFRIDLSAAFQSDRSKSQSPLQHLLHLMPEVLVEVQQVVGIQIRIPGDGDYRFVMYFYIFEHAVSILAYDIFHQHVSESTSRHADDPVQILWHRYYPEGLSVVYFQSHHYVERFINEVRKGMMSVYYLRRQDGLYI